MLTFDPNSGSTIITLLHQKINPKNWQVRYCPLGDAGFLLSFRVVSGDYGKPRNFQRNIQWWVVGLQRNREAVGKLITKESITSFGSTKGMKGAPFRIGFLSPGGFWFTQRIQMYWIKLPKCVWYKCTPWKFNIDPEKKGSQKEIHLPTMIFQGLG